MTDEEFAKKWLDALLGTQVKGKPEIEARVYEMYDLARWKRPNKVVWCGSPVGAAIATQAYCHARQKSGFGLLASITPPLITAVCQKSSARSRFLPNLAAYTSMTTAVSGMVSSPPRGFWIPTQPDEGDPLNEFRNLDSMFTSKWKENYLYEIRRHLPKYECSFAAFTYQFNCDIYTGSIHNSDTVRRAVEADYLWRFETLEPMARNLVDLIFDTELVIPMSDVCFVSDRKLSVHVNASGQLHKDGGPALAYPDGVRMHYLNGVRMRREIVESPAEELDPRFVLSEQNADVRREIVRKIGAERVCVGLGAKVVDKWENYELLLLDIGDKRQRPYLKMLNPSVGTFHIEGVEPSCDTVKKALAWRNGLDKYVHPEQLT